MFYFLYQIGFIDYRSRFHISRHFSIKVYALVTTSFQ